MDDTIADVVRMQSQEAYVCPRKTDWPVYDCITGEYVECTGDADSRESMLELSPSEAASLQLAEVYVDYRRERGKVSDGPTHNIKNNSVWCESSGSVNRCRIAAGVFVRGQLCGSMSVILCMHIICISTRSGSEVEVGIANGKPHIPYYMLMDWRLRFVPYSIHIIHMVTVISKLDWWAFIYEETKHFA